MIGSGLTLVTGPTGGGKTCAVVSWLSDIKDRPLFVMGIPELKIDHQSTPPVDQWTEMRQSPEDANLKLPYFTFPPRAIVILDEAQRVYRPRSNSAAVPPHVAAFETRRHTGVDFVLITQHVGLIDSNLRKLVTRHIHIHDTFVGRYMLEWVGVGDPESKNSRDLATRRRYKPPPKAFSLYKSAELHTKIKRKYPWYFYIFPFLVMGVIYIGYHSYNRFQTRLGADEKTASVQQPVQQITDKTAPALPPAAYTQIDQQPKPMTTIEYIAQYQPRVEGLPHTAPAYDQVTQPVEPPEPVGCITSKKTGCKCYTQQGTSYETTQELCEQILAKGMFMPWKKTAPVRQQTQIASYNQQRQQEPPQEAGNQVMEVNGLPPSQLSENATKKMYQ